MAYIQIDFIHHLNPRGGKLMTNGTKVPMNTSSTFGNSPMPNHMITMGIQAMGGMGRMTSNILAEECLAFFIPPNENAEGNTKGPCDKQCHEYTP